MNVQKEKKPNPPMPYSNQHLYGSIPLGLCPKEKATRNFLVSLVVRIVHSPYGVELSDFRVIASVAPQLKEQVEEVFAFGARKYEPLNFRKVPRLDYIGAMLRHLRAEEECDAESGLPHSAHVLANIMILVDRYILTGEYGTEGYEGGIL